jgi:hypothetical protein
MLHYNWLEMLARDKHSSLLDPFGSYYEIEMLWIVNTVPGLGSYTHLAFYARGIITAVNGMQTFVVKTWERS